MFHNYHAHWRKIKDLPPLVLIRHRVCKITLTMVTAMHLMEVHFIRVAPHLQRMASCPGLPAAFLATMLAKLRVQGFFSPSLEGGLLLLERLLLNLNDPHPVFYQFGDQSNHCFFAFYVCSMYFFSTGQAQRFHVLILIDLHNFVNGKVQRLFMPEQLPIKLDKKWRSNR
jgi:hypothetical protein